MPNTTFKITLQQALDQSNLISLLTDESSLGLHEVKDTNLQGIKELVFYHEFSNGEYEHISFRVVPEQVIDVNSHTGEALVNEIEGAYFTILFKVASALTPKIGFQNENKSTKMDSKTVKRNDTLIYTDAIHTPQSVVQAIRNGSNSVCVKIPFHGYEISIAMDDLCGVYTHLERFDIRVLGPEYNDVTDHFVEPDEQVIYGTGVALHRVMARIIEFTQKE